MTVTVKLHTASFLALSLKWYVTVVAPMEKMPLPDLLQSSGEAAEHPNVTSTWPELSDARGGVQL